jgi:hypothetical protein
MPDDKRPVSKRKRKLIQQLDALEQEDQNLYDALSIDVWALAKTIEEFQPGFWAAFMKNREKALKRFINDVLKSKPVPNRQQQHPFLD